MNLSDLIVIGLIGGFGLIGLKNGFIFSVFRLISFFLSAILAVKFYPLVSNILLKTAVYTNIKASIFKNLMLQQDAQTPKIDAQAKQAAADAVISNLKVPSIMKNWLVNNLPNPSKLLDVSQIMDTISGQLAKVVIDIVALIAIYIIIRILFVFFRFILQGIAKLPLFKQLDKLGGFSFGAIEGLLSVYLVFAFIMLFSSSPSFKGIYESIDNSIIAKFFYQNNFIVNWMFHK